MYEYDFFTFVGIFLKTMQLHGTDDRNENIQIDA
jgi:hypothetical protein